MSWRVELAVRPGQLDGFRALTAEMIEHTRPERGVLAYERRFSDDGRTVHVYERYADSDAALEHLRAFRKNFAARFAAMVERRSFVVSGQPSADLKSLLDGFGATYAASRRYAAILFDLLTALLDSWTLWNWVAGSEENGRRWRAAYLELTYGCGAYRPYEELVKEAAVRSDLSPRLSADLSDAWAQIQPWDDAPRLLGKLKENHRIGIVTNCSQRLGRAAAGRLGVEFDVFVTAERAGFYKPDPAPYKLALSELDLPASQVLFVAGSAFDLIGTARVGLDAYWHNRVGVQPPPGAPRPLREGRTLTELFAR